MATYTPAQLAAEEALAYLEKLGKTIDDKLKERVAKLAADELTAAAIVARISMVSMATSLLQAVEAAVATGVIPDTWARGSLPQALITTGLQRYDPRVMFQATVRSAYSAGRWEKAMEPDALDEMPLFVYRTMRDDRVRDSHAALNGVALPKNHQFWQDHYPPNGWRCRCQAIEADAAYIAKLEKAGITVQTEPPEEALVRYTAPDGTTVELPESVEPGWNFAPGSRNDNMAALLDKRLAFLADPGRR